MLIPGRVAAGYQTAIAELAVKNRLPAMYHRTDFVEAGGLMTYGVNIEDLDRRAANYVDKILKGAKPADLPVEQPTKFELVINLKTAKQIGLTIPPNVLARADRVIQVKLLQNRFIRVGCCRYLSCVGSAEAQQPMKIPRIGFLGDRLASYYVGPR